MNNFKLLKRERLTFVGWAVASWVVFGMFLYGLGVAVVWVRRGFKQGTQQ